MGRPRLPRQSCPICTKPVERRRSTYCSKTCSNMSRAKTLEVRFAEFDARAVMTHRGCREWAGPRDKDGYGVIHTDDDHQIRVARLVLERANGPLPPGHQALHSCDNPPCYAINHLKSGTHQDNIDDKMARGRHPYTRGKALPQTKLSDANLREMWRLYSKGWMQKELAVKFGVRQSTVSRALNQRILQVTPDY
jgi:hypothetical protein